MTQTTDTAENHYQAATWLPGSAKQQGTWMVALGSGLWGLFWLPLRFLDNNGVTGLWAVALVMAMLIVPPMALLISNRTLKHLRSADTWLIGCSFGLSIVLYFTGVIISDVIRVIFLFYLLPVWATLTARILYKETISIVRLFAIALAMVGVWLLLGEGTGIPIPNNPGDWCGLLAGVLWGISLALIRDKGHVNSVAVVGTTAMSATLVASGVASLLLLVGYADYASVPQPDSALLVIIAAAVFSFFLMYPSLIGQAWGAQRVAAPTAALLTMTEIVVATVSAYFLIGTQLNAVSMLGAFIILVAVLIDVIYGIVMSK